MACNPIEVPTMYSYSSGRNIPWNINEYRPVRQYLDSSQLHHQVELKQTNYKRTVQKFQADPKQKVFFLDETIKPVKDNPSPGIFFLIARQVQINLTVRSNVKSQKVEVNQDKSKTIEIHNKKRKHPSVGKYNLTKTDKEIKEELKKMTARKHSIDVDAKRHFYDKDQTNDVPGAGQYNPHLSVQLPAKPSRKNYKYWIKFDTDRAKQLRKKQKKQLAPNSYRPVSASHNSFERMELDFKKLQKSQKKHKPNPNLGFTCSNPRFQYMKQRKIKIQQKRPSSISYNTTIQWKGKNAQLKKNNWVRCLSAGPKRSVYN